MKIDTRVSRKQIEELNQILSDRDKAILESLQKYRLLTTKQIQRLHITNSISPKSAIRVSSRVLHRMNEHGLIETLKRQIGGARAGSSACVWALTNAGFKLLCLENSEEMGRKRLYEPSLHHVKHILLVAETNLQLIEICQKRRLTLCEATPEPMCWRGYIASKGKKASLRPDLFAVTQGKGYTDHWFIEVDRATEATTQILKQCERYIQYFHSGTEQKQRKVFPYVVWLVPDDKRKSVLRQKIREQHARDPNIFVVITPDELETLIVGGVEKYRAKEGNM